MIPMLPSPAAKPAAVYDILAALRNNAKPPNTVVGGATQLPQQPPHPHPNGFVVSSGTNNKQQQQQQGTERRSPPQAQHHQHQQQQQPMSVYDEFKLLSKEEKQRRVGEEAQETDLLLRTVHVRFLPVTMRQVELATICQDCGIYTRVRICGNPQNANQNWIYGFVEFSTQAGAQKMIRKSGMELGHNGKNTLRLKVTPAKQPIVDRVFHDADSVRGTPCLFGQGNFAQRSLKEAVDSYFNLLQKNGQNPAGPDAPVVDSGIVAPRATPPHHALPSGQKLRDSSESTGGESSAYGRSSTGTPPNTPFGTMVPPTPPLSFLPASSAGGGAKSRGVAVAPAPGQGLNEADIFSKAIPHIDVAMACGVAFVHDGTVQTKFFEAMKALTAVHESLDALSSPSAGVPSASAKTALLELRLCAWLIAVILHTHRGSLSEVVPLVTKIMDTTSRVSYDSLLHDSSEADTHSSSQRSNNNNDDQDDDDEAFLNSVTRGAASHVTKEEQVAATRHQVFIAHCLVAVGLAVESINSLIARCVYAAAHRRASTVLGQRCAALEDALKAGGVHKLFHDLFQQQQHGFAGVFFATSANNNSPPQHHHARAKRQLLPPNHVLKLFTSAS